MARQKKQGGSSYSYFQQYFAENPAKLDQTRNDEILADYREAHGLAADAEIEKTVMNNLANVKSIMRKKLREAGQAPDGDAADGGPKAAPQRATRQGNRLEALEEMIDDCLTLAKNQDREGLRDVIGLLRRARNEVVWKLGQ